MPDERAAERQQIGEIMVFCVKKPTCVLSPWKSGPGVVEKFSGGRWKGDLLILRALHRIDRTLYRVSRRRQTLNRLMPDANHEIYMEWKGKSFSQTANLLIFPAHGCQYRSLAFSKKVTLDTLELVFLFFDLFVNIQRLNIDRYAIIQK